MGAEVCLSVGRLEIATKCYRGTAEEEEGGDRKLRGLFIHCPGDQIKDDVMGRHVVRMKVHTELWLGNLKTINRLEDRRRLDYDINTDRQEKGVE